MSIMKTTKHADRTYTFSYCEMVDSENDEEGDIQSYNEITLKPGQVRQIQLAVEFA